SALRVAHPRQTERKRRERRAQQEGLPGRETFIERDVRHRQREHAGAGQFGGAKSVENLAAARPRHRHAVHKKRHHRSAEKRGSGVPRITAALKLGGASNATPTKASDRSQPLKPRDSTGTLAMLQPISVPPAIAFAVTASQCVGGASRRTAKAAPNTISAS